MRAEYRCFLMTLRGADSQRVGKPQPVVTGFLTDDEKNVRGLPVGLATDNQGGVLIADDAGDAIWRISAAQ
ncbi:hypothetical protein CRX72_16760 [Pantoea sp. BRM17]|nr:hypothetical protein CRX72_16760 [Pantoea sp. BRM17]